MINHFIMQPGLMDVDGEGFPLAANNRICNGRRRRRRVEPPRTNNENGEVTNEKVVIIRNRTPATMGQSSQILRHPAGFAFSAGDISREYLCQRHLQSFPIRREYRLYSRFRIQEAIRLGELLNKSSKGPDCFGKKIQPKKNLKNGDLTWTSWGGAPGQYPSKGPSWYKTKKENENAIPKTHKYISVSIWEEFRYGSAIFNSVSGTQVSHGRCEWARPILENFLAKSVVDAILYIIFFAVYFLSCVVYNDYLELGFYLLYDLHLRMHETADRCKIKVNFSGSVFQGPVYCFVRICCQHCAKVESDKVVIKLMQKMKQDIAYFSTA